MIVQIIVAVLLSLMSCAPSDSSTESSSGSVETSSSAGDSRTRAVAPVLRQRLPSRSYSLNDFCESERLRSLAFERWAEDAPKSEVAKDQIARERSKPKHVACDPDSQLDWTDSWLNRNTAGSTLSMLESTLWGAEDLADVKAGLSYRQMSVETLLLFTGARIYAQRAFWGALDEAKLDEERGL